MSKRRQVDACVGARWGKASVILEVVGGEALRAPLPPEMESEAIEGRWVSVYLNSNGRLDGWVLPDSRLGVRMDADLARWGSPPDTLDCQGRCQTLWYLVSGGTLSPGEGCLTCGAPVAAA